MKSKNLFIVLILISIVSVEAFVIFKQSQMLRNFRKDVPVLLKGERIAYFDIIDPEAKKLDASALKRNPFSIIFIFEQPCSICNKNIDYWKGLRKLVKNNIPIYAIVLDNYAQMFDLHQSGRLNFKLYAPNNREEFIKHMRIRFNIAQTILLKEDSVISVKLGTLSNDDFLDILKIIKSSGRLTSK